MKTAISVAVVGALATGSGYVLADTTKKAKEGKMQLTAMEKRKDMKLKNAASMLRELDSNLKIEWVKGKRFGNRIIQING